MDLDWVSQTASPLKAIIAGGSSCPWIAPDKIDTPLGFESLKKVKTMFGSAGTIILNDSVCVVDAMWNILRFYAHESCGQCTPCRVGTAKALALMQKGKWDQPLLGELSQAMMDASICGLGQAAPNPALTVMKYFPQEVG